MKNTRKRSVSADSIARRADKGQGVSRFFTNRGKGDAAYPAREC